MANGFLEHPRQNQEWEDVGKRHLNEILSRCHIQKEEDFFLNFTEMVDENFRRLLLCDEKLVEVPRVLEEMKSVRTVIIQDVSKRSKIVDKSLINLCASISSIYGH
ncbi:hypothetical protein Golax_009523 [Gossypium laxum]|uniref:Uncharacterized protein n=1 Tax=Gossypium laxum TaxID=34288 RepID=A0A7J9AD99_9ROSI|nr:hypothetical protein [Gossypium laxum]